MMLEKKCQSELALLGQERDELIPQTPLNQTK
jgi:hypothetical protein